MISLTCSQVADNFKPHHVCLQAKCMARFQVHSKLQHCTIDLCVSAQMMLRRHHNFDQEEVTKLDDMTFDESIDSRYYNAIAYCEQPQESDSDNHL